MPLYTSADTEYLMVFEVNGDQLTKKVSLDKETEMLARAGWQRIVSLFPPQYRQEIVQYNVIGGRRWAGLFGGDGSNSVGRAGYSFSVANYLLHEEEAIAQANRPVSARRGTLDWTLVHELGHYICLTTNAIELFSQSFDGDMFEQPERRDDPQDYPQDGSPRTSGNFVTSYAERNAGDEEVVETFTTYMTVAKLPTNDSLVARKIRFFNTLPGFPELRQHIQSLGQ